MRQANKGREQGRNQEREGGSVDDMLPHEISGPGFQKGCAIRGGSEELWN